MFKAKVILFIHVLFVILSHTASAYTLNGVVIDKRTGDVLIGATVVVKERPSVGTAAGLDGTFQLKDLPQNMKMTLVARYLGYNEGVYEISSETENLRIELEPQSHDLHEVKVEARYDRATDMGARYIERSAPTVMNVMSARSIEISPDITVANVLQRISGVTMERESSGEGQYAVLRGMDKRYNYTLVNGVKIPSPENKDRYIALDIFPSEMLDRLEVTKSLTPDMEGDATGGVVNLIMKEAPSSRLFNINASVGYNSLFFNNQFMTFDRSGVMMTSPREAFGKEYHATPADFKQGTMSYKQRAALPDVTLGLSWGDRYFDDRLGVVLSGSFQNFNRGTESLFFEDNMPQSESTVRLSSMRERFYSEMKMQYALHMKSDFRLNKYNTFSLYGVYVGNNSMGVRDSKITDLSLNYAPEEGNSLEEWETRSIFERQNIISFTLQGDHRLGRGVEADWSLVWANATNDAPDRTYVVLENDRNNYVDKVRADHMERRWESNSDRDLSAAANFEWAYDEAFAPMSLKWGGLYRDKRRTNDYVSYLFTPDGQQYQGEDFGSVTDIVWKLQASQGSVGPLDYDAHERIGAAYLMYRLGNEVWNVIAGVRAEHTDQGYHMYYPNYKDDPDGGQVYWDFLPSLHLKYSPVEAMNLRLSYFRSVNRPGFFEVVPYSIINEDYTEFGNKDLKRARIDNVDLRWEWFPSVTDQVMVGLFYKNIQDPIEYAYYSVNNRQFGYGPANLGNARNVGVEVDVIKYFRYIGIKANYTYTHSQITTPKTLYSRESGSLQRLSVDQTRPLVGQAPHVANLSLLYKNTEKGWDAQLSFSYTGEKMAVVSHYYEADYWDSPVFSLDASVEKKLGNFSLYAKATNLLNTHYKRYIKTTNAYNYDFPSQSQDRTLIRDNYSGIGFMVGVRYKL